MRLFLTDSFGDEEAASVFSFTPEMRTVLGEPNAADSFTFRTILQGSFVDPDAKSYFSLRRRGNRGLSGVDYRGTTNGNEFVKDSSWWDCVSISAGPTITDVLIAPLSEATFAPWAEISLAFPENINASGGLVYLAGPNATASGSVHVIVQLDYVLATDGLSMVVKVASSTIVPPTGGANYRLFFTSSGDAAAITDSYGYLHRFSDTEPILRKANMNFQGAASTIATYAVLPDRNFTVKLAPYTDPLRPRFRYFSRTATEPLPVEGTLPFIFEVDPAWPALVWQLDNAGDPRKIRVRSTEASPDTCDSATGDYSTCCAPRTEEELSATEEELSGTPTVLGPFAPPANSDNLRTVVWRPAVPFRPRTCYQVKVGYNTVRGRDGGLGSDYNTTVGWFYTLDKDAEKVTAPVLIKEEMTSASSLLGLRRRRRMAYATAREAHLALTFSEAVQVTSNSSGLATLDCGTVELGKMYAEATLSTITYVYFSGIDYGATCELKLK
jgi:hypothetical protein